MELGVRIREWIKLDKIRNEALRSDLIIFWINDKVEENKTKWKDHVDRVVENTTIEVDELSAYRNERL